MGGREVGFLLSEKKYTLTNYLQTYLMLNLFNFDLIVISTTDVFQKDSPHQCSSLSSKIFVREPRNRAS